MARMTDEEANAPYELVTKNPPKVSGDIKNGLFMKHKGNIVIVDDVSATRLRIAGEARFSSRHWSVCLQKETDRRYVYDKR